MKCSQEILWMVLVFGCGIFAEEEDLSQAEAKDGLEIIKTIKKINDDGSYTIGYEADDGSFKIESRDVLGHVKGTYGYVDADGEIKRVSYSSTNFTEALTEAPTVVQRIPKTNKTTTRKPFYLYSPTTLAPSTSTSFIQAIPKRRTTTQTTTSAANTTRPLNVIYATSSPPRVYQRPRSTSSSAVDVQKSEGQILRPEVVTVRPTDFRRVREDVTIKPVTEEPEVRSNLLRRQLSPEKGFDARQHVLSLQQGFGADSVDVYSASLTTGTPRPLFTTTARSRLIPTAFPTAFPTTSIPARYISTSPSTTTEIAQEATTASPVTEPNTPAAPLYHQHPEQQLVPVRHPFHGGVVLVPYTHVRQELRQEVRPEPPQQQYVVVRPTPTPTEPQHPILVRPVLRSIPVQLDEHGYVRPVVTPTPYPVPVAITPPQRHASGDEGNQIESIRPPVSTKDFQRLIELLIHRQSRLEKANALINAQRSRDFYAQRNPYYPYLVRRPQEQPIFVPERPQPFVLPQMQQFRAPTETREVYVQEAPFTPTPTSLTPTKRVARLLHNPPGAEDENYLPPQIREMLLLRMLQLAINPALPLEDNEEQDSMPSEQHVKKTGVRNVEVLGEEENEDDKKRRYGRYYH